MKQGILIIVIILFAFMLFLYFWQRHLIYLPIRNKPNIDDYAVKGLDEVHFKTDDGLTLYAWYKPARPSFPTLVYVHGNAGHIGYRVPIAEAFIHLGFGVFLLEYRGYGGNPGTPHEQGLYKDGNAAIQYLKGQGVLLNQMILFGESLGSGVATQLALNHSVCAVVLLSPYTSMTDLARYHYPWVWLKPWDRFESLKKISRIKAPLLIIHGTKDDIVPIQQARALYSRANEPKQMYEFQDAGHNDLISQPSFFAKILLFSQMHCGQ